MPYFKVRFSGHLYRKWPLGKQIELANCCFTSGSGDREFIVHAEIDAKNEEQARNNGRESCSDAVHLLEFCIGELVYLDESQCQITRKEGKVTTGQKSFSISAELVKDSPLTEEQLEEVKRAQTTLKSEQDPERKETLVRAIHWQALGRRETKSQIDRFIKFWIALEVLVYGKGKKVVPKVKEPLLKLYPSCRVEKIGNVVGCIDSVRGYIVHVGVREPKSLQQKLKQLEAILGDLLRQRLGLSFKALAKQYLL